MPRHTLDEQLVRYLTDAHSLEKAPDLAGARELASTYEQGVGAR